MLFVERIGSWNCLLVPAIVAGLIATEKQERGAAGIEGVEYAKRPAIVLDAEFAHMGDVGTGDAGAVRVWERGAGLLQHCDETSYTFLLRGGELDFVPGAEVFSELDFLGHRGTIPCDV